jgi:hypothetical protein
MGFRNKVEWTGLSITLGELIEFTERACNANIGRDEQVQVLVGQKFNNPTDLGGEIYLSVSGGNS